MQGAFPDTPLTTAVAPHWSSLITREPNSVLCDGTHASGHAAGAPLLRKTGRRGSQPPEGLPQGFVRLDGNTTEGQGCKRSLHTLTKHENPKSGGLTAESSPCSGDGMKFAYYRPHHVSSADSSLQSSPQKSDPLGRVILSPLNEEARQS